LEVLDTHQPIWHVIVGTYFVYLLLWLVQNLYCQYLSELHYRFIGY